MPSARFDRRDVLQLAAVGVSSTLFTSSVTADDRAPDEAHSAPLFIVDSNVSLFQWPFRRLPLDTTEALVRKLRTLGVSRALAGTFEGLLHRDLAAVNRRLAEACAEFPEFIPVGAVNPTLPGWQDDLRRCVEDHGMTGIRLHPGYHQYDLTDSRFPELLDHAVQARVFVQLAAAMEDGRTQHSLVRVPDVDLTPLPKILAGFPQATLQILNARLRPTDIEQFRDTPGILFDTSRLDGTDAVPSLIRSLPQDRVLFGSLAPLLVPEAAMIRVHESGQLQDDELRAVYGETAVARLGVATA